MTRTLYDPVYYSADINVNAIVPVSLGGTSSTTVSAANTILNLPTMNMIGSANGIAGLYGGKMSVSVFPTGVNGVVIADANGKIPLNLITSDITTGITVNGPKSVIEDTANTYVITNFNSFINYTISTTNGVISRNGDTITYTPSTVGNGGFTVNDKIVDVTVTAGMVAKPSITSPSVNATGVSLSPTFTSSAFGYLGAAQTQTRVRWELATGSNFSNIVASYEGTSNYNSWSILPTQLDISTNYYVRVRYQGSTTGWSEWSDVRSFTTTSTSGWVGQLNYSGSGASSKLTGIAVSPDGNSIYGVGFTNPTNTRYPIIAKWNKDGTHQWTKIGNSNTYLDVFNGVAISPDGTAIYVVGSAQSAVPGFDIAYIAKFNTSGTLQWQSNSGTLVPAGTPSGVSHPNAIHTVYQDVAVSPDGTAIYAVGHRYREDMDNVGAILTKWTNSGSVTWNRMLGGNGEYRTSQDWFSGVAISPDGTSIYAVGSFSGSTAIITKWNTSGTIQWQKSLNGGGFEKVTVSQDNASIYVVGMVNNEVHVSKWNSSGALQWQRAFALGTPNVDNVKVSPDGSHIYIVGSTTSQAIGDWDSFIIKLTNAGDLVWQRSLASSARDYLMSVAVSPDGGTVYASGVGQNSNSIILSMPGSGNITLGSLTGAGMTGTQWRSTTFSALTRSHSVFTATFTSANATTSVSAPVSLFVASTPTVYNSLY